MTQQPNLTPPMPELPSEKIKSHWQRNKKTYLVLLGGFILGGMYAKRKAPTFNTINMPIEDARLKAQVEKRELDVEYLVDINEALLAENRDLKRRRIA